MEALRHHENEMVASIFGATNRSNDTIRKDQSLARDFMDAVMQGNYKRIDSAPTTNLVEISEKYLTAVLPILLPSSRQTLQYKLENFCTVTRRGGHVTSTNEESVDEKNRRSLGTPPLVALPAGFFTGT
jgi:hypothetical protein